MSALAPLGQDFRTYAVDGVRAALVKAGLDGALFLSAANVLYLCGWTFSVNERPIGLFVPVEGMPTLFIPELERENAEPVPNVIIKRYDEFPGEIPPVLWMAIEANAKSVAIDILDAALFQPLTDRLTQLVLKDMVAPLRYIKTAQEIALTKEAATFADLCLERLLANAGAIISAGGSELDLLNDSVAFAKAALIAKHGKAFAGTKMGITASVHSGPRAALPHGATSDRVPRFGETLISGIGASLGGYHAESGITLIVGEMSAEHRRVMAAMQACNDAGIAALVPGATCESVNVAALDALRAADLGDAIRHRIGHGMGVEGHEAPWLAPGDPTLVAANMVFSNEPGVYRPECDGYRTINTMIVTETGVEIPSRFQSNHPIDTRVIAL